MKVKQLLEYLQQLPKECLNKEVTFVDYENLYSYDTPKVPTVIDESDEKYLDLVFNYKEK